MADGSLFVQPQPTKEDFNQALGSLSILAGNILDVAAPVQNGDFKSVRFGFGARTVTPLSLILAAKYLFESYEADTGQTTPKSAALAEIILAIEVLSGKFRSADKMLEIEAAQRTFLTMDVLLESLANDINELDSSRFDALQRALSNAVNGNPQPPPQADVVPASRLPVSNGLVRLPENFSGTGDLTPAILLLDVLTFSNLVKVIQTVANSTALRAVLKNQPQRTGASPKPAYAGTNNCG